MKLAGTYKVSDMLLTPEPEPVVHDMDTAYFANVHPVYPFLDQQDFQRLAAGSYPPKTVQSSEAFSALYHTVLALGSQYEGCGSFQPGSGRSFELFQMSLGNLSTILVPPYSLVHLEVPSTAFSNLRTPY